MLTCVAGIRCLAQQAHPSVVGIVETLRAHRAVRLHFEEEPQVVGLMFGTWQFLSGTRSDGGGRWPQIFCLLVLGQTLGLQVEMTPHTGNLLPGVKVLG